MMKLMFTREVALASRPLKSKVFRGPLFFSEKPDKSTIVTRNLSETIEEDLRKGGVGSDSFLRDVYAGWEVGSENYGSVLMLTAMTLFSSGSSTLLSAMCVKHI